MIDPNVTDADDDLFAEASGWYYRLQAEDLTPTEREAFAAWLAQGPSQVRAWNEVLELLGALREPARQSSRRCRCR